MRLIIGVLGGLSFFLYGMHLMSSSLKIIAGKKLNNLIKVLTKNKFISILIGAFVTMIMQSSSATTVMVVGFVNAKIMTLSQAIGVIMGANIGTTITGQLIAFKLTDIAIISIIIGVTFWIFSYHNKKYEILIGFGMLFVGINMMAETLKPLSYSDVFVQILSNLENPVLGIFVGFLITSIIQSSSASMGLLLSVASLNLINLDMALPIIFGQNMGTCVTTLISSIGGNINAKRAAIMHLLFNTFGTILFFLVLRAPFQYLILYVSPNNTSRQIVNAHTLFNILNVLIQFPFSDYIVYASIKLVPHNKKAHISM